MTSRSPVLAAAIACLVAVAGAAPTQLVLDSDVHASSGFDYLKHMAGISPYFELDTAHAHPPDNCRVESAAYIIRHGAIWANDEEWEEDMEAFVWKLGNFTATSLQTVTALPPLDVLLGWQSPFTDPDNQLEMLTEPGGVDAEKLGRSFGHLYPHLKPNGTDPFNIWAADTPRDVATAKHFIKGALPEHDRKGKGTGDGHVRLIRVPKKTPDWKASLTPHKACPRFDKANGKPERAQFKDIYTAPIIDRFNELMPGFNFSPDDIIAMQQLCGYEISITGKSALCGAFQDQDWLSFEYYNDLYYHYMMGYGLSFAPELGMPFLKTATARILNMTEPSQASALKSPAKHPHRAPNDTSTGQRLYAWFAHREEIPLVAVSLGLFNNSDVLPDTPLNATMPATHIPLVRLWRTSSMIPFLGHIALERMVCADGDHADEYVRVIVNSTPVPLPACHSGPADSCPMKDFEAFMEDRLERYGDFAGACGIKDADEVPTVEVEMEWL